MNGWQLSQFDQSELPLRLLATCPPLINRQLSQLSQSELAPWLLMTSRSLIGCQISQLSQSELASWLLMTSHSLIGRQISQLSQSELASRLTLSSTGCRVEADKLRHLPVTLLQALDATALTEQARSEAERCYPQARIAHLKTGGNFPFLTRPDETDMFIQVGVCNRMCLFSHLRLCGG